MTRDKIIAAALSLFAKNGYEGTSLSEIAKAVAVGSILDGSFSFSIIILSFRRCTNNDPTPRPKNATEIAINA